MGPIKSDQTQNNWLIKKIKRVSTFAYLIFLSPYRFFKFACFAVGVVTFFVLFCFSLYTAHFLSSLPAIGKIQFADLKKIAKFSINGKLEDKGKRYRWVSINEIHRDFLYAVVMSEDSSFFEHNGFELDAMLDSLAENIRKRKIESGGSTITQQVVKNVFLTNEKNLTRKFKELLITKSLEERFTKNEILEIYLNIAEFGPDIVGVNAAAHKYFDKTPDEINAAEGAFLALMLPSPRRHHYSIFENENLTRANKNRIRRILGDMLHNEYISFAQYQRYLKYDYFGTKQSNFSAPRKRHLQRGLAGKKK